MIKSSAVGKKIIYNSGDEVEYELCLRSIVFLKIELAT